MDTSASEAVGLTADKLNRGGRRIIAGTPERSSPPRNVAVAPDMHAYEMEIHA